MFEGAMDQQYEIKDKTVHKNTVRARVVACLMFQVLNLKEHASAVIIQLFSALHILFFCTS
jgi:hypothetical protein